MTAVIGTLRHRLTLQAPQRTPEDGGTATIAWSHVTDLFARIRPLAGREIVSADGLAARVTHEVTIRMTENVAPQMRFVFGTRTFDIHAVLDIDGRRRWLRCLCEERLP